MESFFKDILLLLLQYLRSLLGLQTCVDLLLLAHQHHAQQLRKDVVRGQQTVSDMYMWFPRSYVAKTVVSRVPYRGKFDQK